MAPLGLSVIEQAINQAMLRGPGHRRWRNRRATQTESLLAQDLHGDQAVFAAAAEQQQLGHAVIALYRCRFGIARLTGPARRRLVRQMVFEAPLGPNLLKDGGPQRLQRDGVVAGVGPRSKSCGRRLAILLISNSAA